MLIRKSKKLEINDIEKVHLLAFGKKEGGEIVELVHNLIEDKTAEPLHSLIAVEKNNIVGHVLFTKASISSCEVPVQILAPLAVLPEKQGEGIGGKLIKEGLSFLEKSNVGLVFVLGYPKYYSRFGFLPAGELEFEAPYPIKKKNKDAWMVLELKPGIIGKVKGKIACAKSMNKPEYWTD